MAKFNGVHEGFALFSNEAFGVLVNLSTFDVFDPRPLSELNADLFEEYDRPPHNFDILQSLAIDALPHTDGDSDIALVSSSKPRVYRIPKAVQQNAQFALSKVRKNQDRPDPIALNTARTLVRGGSLAQPQIINLARFFRLMAGETELSNSDQLSWELFGGDAARRWAGTISSKVLPRPLIAAAEDDTAVVDEEDEESYVPDPKADTNADEPHVFFDVEGFPEICGVFCSKGELDPIHVSPEELPEGHPQSEIFDTTTEEAMAEPVAASSGTTSEERLLPDELYIKGEGIEFKAERHPEDVLQLTDLYYTDLNNNWFRFNNVESGWVISAPPEADADVVPLDEATAFTMMNRIAAVPNEAFDVRDAYPEETAYLAMAGDSWQEDVDLLTDSTFEMYTPQERSQNAMRQVRDRNGRFARTGTNVSTTGNRKGRVVGFNQQQGKVEVKMDDNGRSEYFDENQIAISQPGNLDAKPRQSTGKPKARLTGNQPVLDADALQATIAAYEQHVAEERARVKSSETFAAEEPAPAAAPAEAPAPAASGDAVEPGASDVKPIYMAIVDDLDPTAVLELVALVPKAAPSTELSAFKRTGKKWVEDSNLLLQLKSVTPPKVVSLDQATYQDVVKQVDAFEDSPEAQGQAGASPQQQVPAPAQPAPAPVAAAIDEDINYLVLPYGEYGETIELAEGGFDKNRGNAETLRRYWLYGPGAAKIGWGVPGDFMRCVSHLSKYMGTRAKGYCQLRHKDATGHWTGDKNNHFGLEDAPSSEQVITAAVTRASLFAADTEVEAPESSDGVEEGPAFRIPVLVPTETPTGDKRTFDEDSLSSRAFPLSLLWQIKTGDKHDGSVIVGRIDGCDVGKDGLVNAYGVFDVGPYAKEAHRLVKGKFLRGVSADLSDFEGSLVEEDAEALGAKGIQVSSQPMRIRNAKLTAATLVPKPAFEECVIELDEQSEVAMKVADGVYEAMPDDGEIEPMAAAALVASAIPVNPPSSWFEDPELKAPTPLTVEDDGRVFGHIASWHIDHVGRLNVRAPRSRSGYAYFHTGVVRCDDGKDVPVGQLTMGGSHPDLTMSAQETLRHYDNTSFAVADVHAGEDRHGIWVSGALRPGVTPAQIRELRASAPSGDWRPINGRLEMIAVLQVNSPGFPITRALVASGHTYALVAAGASTIARLRPDPVAELAQTLETRISSVESFHSKLLADAREAQIARVAPVAEAQQAALIAAATEAVEKVNTLIPTEEELFADISTDTRKRYAKEGKALPDGSYPIPDVSHLRKAIQAYGRAAPGDKAKVKRHIKRRARALGRADLVPEKWKSVSVDERAQDISHQFRDMLDAPIAAASFEVNERFEALAADTITERTRKLLAKNMDFEESKHPRDSEGKFRDVVARLRDTLKTVPEADEAVKELDDAQKQEAEKNFAKAKQAADRAIHILDNAVSGVTDIKDASVIRDAAKQLGKVVAFLPVAVGVDTVAYSFEQLPQEVQDVFEQLLKRAEAVPDQSDDQKEAIAVLKGFRSGADQWTQAEINSSMSRLVRMII